MAILHFRTCTVEPHVYSIIRLEHGPPPLTYSTEPHL